MNFKNTAYIIMGGTTGMGLAAALALVNQGAKVLVVGRNKDSCDKAKQLLGEGNLAMNGDATDQESMEKAIQLAHDTFGNVTGLFHVAGGSGRKFGDGPLDTISLE
ncbi:MAG: SDR family oxidoreductase, partial [Flavobacteriaceae bacterium]